MRLQWDSHSASGKDKIWVSPLPLTAPGSLSARMSHFVLLHWMVIQIFIGESSPAFCVFAQETNVSFFFQMKTNNTCFVKTKQ